MNDTGTKIQKDSMRAMLHKSRPIIFFVRKVLAFTGMEPWQKCICKKAKSAFRILKVKNIQSIKEIIV
jgi:hypothetical protein